MSFFIIFLIYSVLYELYGYMRIIRRSLNMRAARVFAVRLDFVFIERVLERGGETLARLLQVENITTNRHLCKAVRM